MPRTLGAGSGQGSRSAASAAAGTSKGSYFLNGRWVSVGQGAAALPPGMRGQLNNALATFSGALANAKNANGVTAAISAFLSKTLGVKEGAMQRVIADFAANLIDKHFNSAALQDTLSAFGKQVLKYGMSQAKTSSIMPNIGAGASAASKYAKGLVKSTLKQVIIGEAYNALNKELRGTAAEKGWNYYQRARKNSKAARKRTNSRLYNQR